MVTIRPFKDGDEQATWDVFYSSIHQVCVKDYSPEQIEAWAPASLDPAVWQSKVQSLKPNIATIDGKVVGYADCQASGLIDHFYVNGDYQAQGVGQMLMQTILNSVDDYKTLFSEVSHTAKPFFQQHGFKVLKVQQVFMHEVMLENNRMQRRGV